jgi:hypothetical protein
MKTILLLGFLMSISPASQTNITFPPVEGRNLEGRAFHLPADFEGDLNVVLVAFKREQQADVDTWTPGLKRLLARHSAIRVYELPTLGRRYRLIRSVIDGGMRGGIPDAAVRAATITLYIDKAPFERALSITGEDEIQVFLVDRSGRVHWRGHGRFSEAAAAELEQRLPPGADASR